MLERFAVDLERTHRTQVVAEKFKRGRFDGFNVFFTDHRNGKADNAEHALHARDSKVEVDIVVIRNNGDRGL